MTRVQKNKEKKRSKKQINSKNVTLMNWVNNVELIKQISNNNNNNNNDRI